VLKLSVLEIYPSLSGLEKALLSALFALSPSRARWQELPYEMVSSQWMCGNRTYEQ
jgi:hypothetical protein